MSILGTRVLRTEDPRFLTTGGVYTEDVTDEALDGACHVFFVRSPIAHARIGRVDLSAALAAPGVVAAFTGADLADLPVIEPMMAGHAEREDDQAAAGDRQGPLRRRAGRRRRHRGPVPGRGRGRAGRRGLRAAARRGRLRRRAVRRDDPVRGRRHQRGRRVRQRGQPEARALRRLRGRGQPHDRQPAGRARADGVPGGRRGLGRGRQAHHLDPEPGRAGRAGRPGQDARPSRRARSG